MRRNLVYLDHEWFNINLYRSTLQNKTKVQIHTYPTKSLPLHPHFYWAWVQRSFQADVKTSGCFSSSRTEFAYESLIHKKSCQRKFLKVEGALKQM